MRGLDREALQPWLEAVGPVAIVDLETTGLPGDPRAELLEFAVVLLAPDAPEVLLAATTVKPVGEIPPAIVRLTGIRPADVVDSPAASQLAGAVRPLLAGRTLVAHNAEFERHFLDQLGWGPDSAAGDLDTQDVLALTHPDAPDLRLESFTRALLEREERHRAADDALDTTRVLCAVGRGAARGQARYAVARENLERYAPDSPWLALLAPAPAPACEAHGQFVEIGDGMVAAERVPFDADAIAAALADATRGAHFFPGYRVRREQIELARAVVRALRDEEVLLLEGGTGVGKSLAYLAALIPFAMNSAERGSERGPVVISTRTKLLQDQLLAKDIPAAARFLGYPELRAISIKGRANYACERRLASVLAEGLEPRIFREDRYAYAVLAAGAATRAHGEVAALPGAWLRRYPVLPDLLRRSVAARAEQCSREQCARHPGCSLGRRRAALGEAQLIVANHDLLLRWPADYPAFAHAVVDEAHELAGVADEVYAQTVRPDEVLERLDDLFGRPDAGGADAGLLSAGQRRAFRRDAAAWRRTVQQDLLALGRSLEPHASEFGEVQIPYPPPGGGARFEPARELADQTAQRLETVVREVEAELGPGADPGVTAGLDALRDAAGALELAFEGSDASVASFERIEPPYDRWTLSVRPVSPTEPFREALLERLKTFVGVSASLLIDGRALAALGELEIEASEAHRLERVSVPSPFPYADHMRVIALGPDPTAPDLVDATARTLHAVASRLGGRTLGLFTSLRRMHEVAERLAPQLAAEGLELITPRRASDDPAALLERFRRGGAVLLGARRFWQGVDLPGEQLRAVVIEKLPFEVPTELRKRRELRLRRAGRDAFDDFTLGKMLLHLKQMVGRLIRTEDDRGVVLLVESRRERAYFRRVREALPPGCPLLEADLRDLDEILKQVGLP